MKFDEDDIRQRLQGSLEGMDVPRDIPPATVKRARTRRMRWISLVAGLTAVVAIAGLAGAGTLLSDDDRMDPAPKPERGPLFARYFFDAAAGRTSARGVLEVDADEGTLCLDGTYSSNVKAAHLIDQHPDGPPPSPAGGLPSPVAVTFFEPDTEPEGFFSPEAGVTCVRTQDLELLDTVIDEHERFALDFHRGPNDDPGLVAELRSQKQHAACSDGPTIEFPSAPHTPGKRAAFIGECWPDGSQEISRKMFLTATVTADGVPVSKQDSKKAEDTCRFVAELDNRSVLRGNGRLGGWFVVPINGNCHKGPSLRTDMPIRTGTYTLAIGCVECSYATVRVKARPLSRWSSPSVHSSEVVYYGFRRNVDTYCGAYDRSYVARPVDVPEGEGSVLTHALRALFAEEWDVPPSRVEKVEILNGRAIIYLTSMDGLGFAGTSCGSIGFQGAVLRTAFQFDSIESVEIWLDGSCRAFGEFIQSARCDTFTRDTLADRRRIESTP